MPIQVSAHLARVLRLLKLVGTARGLATFAGLAGLGGAVLAVATVAATAPVVFSAALFTAEGQPANSLAFRGVVQIRGKRLISGAAPDRLVIRTASGEFLPALEPEGSSESSLLQYRLPPNGAAYCGEAELFLQRSLPPLLLILSRRRSRCIEGRAHLHRADPHPHRRADRTAAHRAAAGEVPSRGVAAAGTRLLNLGAVFSTRIGRGETFCTNGTRKAKGDHGSEAAREGVRPAKSGSIRRG